MNKNSRINVVLSLMLLLIFCWTRLYEIHKLPLFLDEALYIRWTDTIAEAGWSGLLAPLNEDGQPPLFFWISAVIKKYLLPGDSLLVLRLMSISFGSLAMVGGMGLAYQISKSKRAAWIFGFLYVSVPYTLILERIGMRDSAMTFVFLSSLLGIYSWQKSNQLRSLIFSGAVLSLGIWIKSIAWLAVFSSLLLLVILNKRPAIRAWIAILAPLIISVAVLYFMGAVNSITQKNSIFLIEAWPSISQVRDNTYQVMIWLNQYLSTLLFIFLIFLIAAITLKKDKTIGRFVLVVSAPLMIEIVIAEIFFPRYFLISVGGFLVILALYLEKLSRKIHWTHFAVALLVLLMPPLTKSIQYVQDPLQTTLPQIEQWQYISGWPAGYGVAETANFLMNNPVDYIFTEESDLLRTGISYYKPALKNNLKVIHGDLSRSSLLAAGLTEAMLQEHEVVLALHLKQELPVVLKGEILFSVQKPNNGDQISIYRINGYK